MSSSGGGGRQAGGQTGRPVEEVIHDVWGGNGVHFSTCSFVGEVEVETGTLLGLVVPKRR